MRPRLPSRSRWGFVLVPIALVLLASGLKLATMSWFSSRGASAYADAHYGSSATEYDRLAWFNIVEPWRAHFGTGTALYRNGDLEGAEEAFRRAIELAPDRCEVRFNLVVTIEAQGDLSTGGEQREVEDVDRADGLARYRVALDLADAALCPADSSGAGTRLAETRERLRHKLGAESSDDGDDVEAAPERRDEEQDQTDEETGTEQQQLANRNQSGAAEREDHSDLDPTQVHAPNESNW